MNEEIDTRDYDKLTKSIGLAQHTVYKRYLSELDTYPIVQPTKILLDETAENCVRLIQLEELAYKKGEDIFQKLTTVYHASMSLGCNLVVIVDVESINAPAKVYIGVKNGGFNNEEKASLRISFKTLKNGLKSNFPGTKFKDVPSRQLLPQKIDEIFGDFAKHISSVSCVASIRDKSKTEEKSFIQGIERLIDAMHGNTYTAIFIAKPVTHSDQALIRGGYENIYSALSSFRKSSWTYSSNESHAVMESLSHGVSKAITTGTSHTQSHTTSVGANLGMNASKNQGVSHSHMEGSGITRPTAASRVGQALSGAAGAFGWIGSIISPIYPSIGGVLSAVGGAMSGASKNESNADTITNSICKSLGVSGGTSGGTSNTTSDTTLETETNTETDTTTTGTTDTTGTGKNLQIENTNKPIDDMLGRIDELLKRAQECEDYGAYNCAVYFVSGKQESCMLGANTLKALMLGEGSSIETGAINFWNGEKNKEKVSAMKEYIKRFEHPLFAMPISENLDSEEDFVQYTAGTIVSGLELPLHIGLPTRSVYGMPVIEHAEFGKEVIRYTNGQDLRKCELGSIFGMGDSTNTKVKIDVDSLTMHTFITGSTGSGKSNAIYVLLRALKNDYNIPFLVVEPAKGEYKNIFGTMSDVKVYGTNPQKTELLRVNPFSFPEGIHVLEHMDRLVEIFNVCWPMYAAMPALLKESLEKAYISVGWDLCVSENPNGKVFPTFSDLLEQIECVIFKSQYSADSKGDYIGALVARIRSLTTGLNGLIFSEDEISNTDLFDQCVIADLSRVGSTETKSLIMGLLVMKLNEYRMDKGKLNSPLNHITVLEEAHNLLKRTSSEQHMDSSNLTGKSVEMLSNSIAEMRAYGEGFVIADQAPGLLDLSVIRNTNTKIILRLPEKTDRELVGYAASLNDDQITELAKLKKGVAAIYQNDWVEAVLVQINKSDLPEVTFECKRDNKVFEKKKNYVDLSDLLTMALIDGCNIEMSIEKKKMLAKWIDSTNIVESSKRMLKRVLAGISLNDNERREICYNAFSGQKIANTLLESIDDDDTIHNVDHMIATELHLNNDELVRTIRNNIITKASEIPVAAELPNRYKIFMGGIR